MNACHNCFMPMLTAAQPASPPNRRPQGARLSQGNGRKKNAFFPRTNCAQYTPKALSEHVKRPTGERDTG